MAVHVEQVQIGNVLTRTTGFLRTVSSHSLQPYRGCTFGSSLCGVGCYVRHNTWVTGGRQWGSFLEARVNAGTSYLAHHEAERRWATRQQVPFAVFLSSSTDPFVPQERHFGITASVLTAMVQAPPDELILQTHSHTVSGSIALLQRLEAAGCDVRVHLSIESDIDRLPGLPAPASSVERRFAAAGAMRAAGLRVVITVAPLLPIAQPDAFFQRIAGHADAVVIDHFIGGDGSADGGRTQRTALPDAMRQIDPASLAIGYRQQIVDVARRHMPGRVGVHIDGFAGRFLP